MKIAIGADHNAFEFKEKISIYLKNKGFDVVDFGCHSSQDVDYPGIAFTVCDAVLKGDVDRAILFCGTGIGMALAANKVPGIRAAVTHDVYSGERAYKSNGCQVITFGSQVIGLEAAKKVIDVYTLADVVDSNSARKVQQIMDQEQEFLGAK